MRLRAELVDDYAYSFTLIPGSDVRLDWVTPELESVLGLRAGERIAPDAWKTLVPGEDHTRVSDWLERVATGTAAPLEHRLRTREGRALWLRHVARAVPMEQGVRVDGTALDIGERMAALESLTQAEHRAQALEQACARLRHLQPRLLHAAVLGAAEEIRGHLTHAINNPLTALLGHAQMELESSQPSREGLRRVHGLAQRIQSVATHVLDRFREATLQLERADPHELLTELQREIGERAATRGIELRRATGPGLPSVLVDRALWISALAHLTDNALDATPDGGAVELEVAFLPDADVVQFRIADRGPGVPSSLAERVFDAFFTTKSRGIGLGLTLANGIVRGHGGRIEARPRAGGGTEFRADLPSKATTQLHAEPHRR